MQNQTAIIAANLDITEEVIEYINKFNINVPIIVLNEKLLDKLNYNNISYISLEKTGKIIDFCKENNINKLLFTGKFERPDLITLRPDFKGAKLLFQILKARHAGDDNLLKVIINFLANENISVIGIQEFIPGFLEKQEFKEIKKPDKEQMESIDIALEIARDLGKLDIGQSLIVNNKRIIAVEAAEGTDELIRRSSNIKVHNNNSILVKLTKPNQDLRIDLPAIGPNTIDLVYDNNLVGIVIDKSTLVINKQIVIEKLQKYKLFCLVIQ